MATPSYSFSVSAANFFILSEFESFKNSFKLGDKIYLSILDGKVLQPIAVGVEISFEDPSSFSIQFGDKYTLSSSEFKLVDLLEQSISMGKTVDFSKYNYSSFVNSGASTSVKEFMDGAVDAAKNNILSSSGQAVSWDGSGIKLRQHNSDQTGYLDEQIAIINNSIVFTDDNWATAKMAIGKFSDVNTGTSWGMVAPALVGTLMASNSLIVESAKKDGGKSVFRVDGDGAALYNSTFDLYNGSNTQITLNPYSGIAIGEYPLYTDDEYTIDTDKAKLWIDTEGNLHLKGTLEGVDGYFKGIVQATDFLDGSGKSMLTNGKFDSDYLDLGNIQLDGTTGDITMEGNINIGGNINFASAGSITWGSNTPVKYQFSVNGTSDWHIIMTASDMYRRDSLDGGVTWGAAYQFRGQNGNDGYNGSDASVTRGNIVLAMLNSNPKDGLYSANIDGEMALGIRATAVMWGSGLGTLATTRGSRPNGEVTDLAHIQSDQGMLLSAKGGGLRFDATGGIYLTDPTMGNLIRIGDTNNNGNNWKTLSQLISETKGTAVFA